MNLHLLVDFLAESNRIEGIDERVDSIVIQEADRFLLHTRIAAVDVARLVRVLQPNPVARLRDHKGCDVTIAGKTAPPGGPHIGTQLKDLCQQASESRLHPCLLHQKYELLHPFTDGNGRSGRLLWAWQMLHDSIHPGLNLLFLEAYYRQTLEIERLAPRKLTALPDLR